MSFQRGCVPIGCSTLCFLATGDIAMSWLAVDTSDVPYVLKLASGEWTSWGAGNTAAELRRTNQIFGLKRKRTRNREGRVQQRCFLRSLMLQQARFPHPAYPSFEEPVKFFLIQSISAGWHILAALLLLYTYVAPARNTLTRGWWVLSNSVQSTKLLRP